MANSTCKIKDRQVFGEHVDSTLLLVEIHRCKICNFYSAHSGAMSDHIWASHAETLGGDVTRVPGYKEALQEQDPDIPLKRVLNEIQNLPSLKSLPPKDQVDLKFLSNLRKDCGAGGFQLQQSAMLNDSELNLSRLFEFLISESYSFESESLPEQDPGRYFREDTDMKESESREIFTAVMDPGFKVKNIAENPIVHRTKRISRSQDYRAKLAKINSPKAASISASSVKLDFNRAYENMLEAAKATNSKERKNVSVVDVRVSSEKPKQPFVDLSQSLEEPIQSQAPGSALEPVQVPGTTSEPDQEFLPQLSLLDPDDTSKVESAAMSGQEKNPENDLQLQSSLSGDGESNVDTVAGPSTGEDTLKNAASPVNRGPAPDGDQPTPEVPPIIKGSKTYAHNVDFQAIAQQASHSNPEATTITVVQHTSGDRPPLTINFKKSHKSEAIIPTGESLGIRSPFRKMEYSGSKVFACKECHSRYKTANELERHVLKKHQKKKSYLCEICGDALATRSGMKVHIQRKHAVSDVLTCDVCDYMTRSTTRFAVHLKKHNKSTSSFYCEPCKKSFVTESKLEQHKKSPMHKNAVDPIICEHCGYVTKKRDNFLVHIRKHTGEKPYRCKHCDYGAADGSTLKRHVMARHSSIRPFRCTDCQFSCVDKKGLTVHMRKHTDPFYHPGERPYRCDLCPYAAKRSGALTVHRRTHFVDKPSELSPKEDTDTSTEVASYVDISEIPIAHMPLGNALLQSTSQPRIHVPTQNQGSSSIAASQQGITPNQSSNSTVQEQDHTVQALWQSMS